MSIRTVEKLQKHISVHIPPTSWKTQIYTRNTPSHFMINAYSQGWNQLLVRSRWQLQMSSFLRYVSCINPSPKTLITTGMILTIPCTAGTCRRTTTSSILISFARLKKMKTMLEILRKGYSLIVTMTTRRIHFERTQLLPICWLREFYYRWGHSWVLDRSRIFNRRIHSKRTYYPRSIRKAT